MMERGVESEETLPTWLECLLSEKFFNSCLVHEDAKKNEKNMFCVECCEAICNHCLHLHNSHRLLQIRRYVYNDVIRVEDAEKLMDCSCVQAYTTNSAKVVFLKSRPQTRACGNLSNNCISCERGLQDPYLFCSISCKIHHIMTSEGLMSGYLHECEVLTPQELSSDDWLMTPDSDIDPFVSLTTSSANRRKGMPRRSPFI
ncbi:protein RGF1 INDUCIBLE TRANSCRIPTION FACTOR 1-like [Bidens hawaiensis]|uniref:protein RGF1 INDUCIBLE TRANSCRIPTION FACTOR 1-like n=1 Tax=Bidens hawaiensis TaxID=980011 RepID=UPI00404A6606